MLLVSGLTYSQVGINTPDPKATFDITAKNSTGNFASAEGLLLPRVDRQKAQYMTGVQNSTLIYVNDVSTGSKTGAAINIDVVGYYYYTGSAWVKWNAIITTDTNIYNLSSTLTSDRKVAQNDKTLAIKGTVRNTFSIDGTTFSVDAASKRIGIITSSPMNKLDLGPSGASSATDPAGKKLALFNDSTGNNFYGAGVGLSTLQFFAAAARNSSPGITLNSSKYLGIGTSAPASNLHVNGSVKITDGTEGEDKVLTTDADGVATWETLPESFILKNFYNSDGLLTSNRTVSQGNYLLGFAGAVQQNAFSVAGTTFSVDAANHRLGIGTSTPKNLLDMGSDLPTSAADPESKKIAVYNNTTGTSFYGLGASTDKLLFHAASAGDAAPAMVLTSEGNVGIGNTEPVTSSILDISSTNKGFLPTRLTEVQRDALNPKVPGLMIYNKDINCMQYWNNLDWVDDCLPGSIETLNCAGAAHYGALYPNIPASGAYSLISYTGGNGEYQSGSFVTSTGITGLTAKLAAGNFNNGNGTLTFTITGTPSGIGTAYFAIEVAGIKCTFSRTITEPAVPAYSGCSWYIPKLGYGQSTTGYINNKPVTATLTYEYNTQSFDTSNKIYCGMSQPSNHYWFGKGDNTSSLTMKFSRKVSNLAITLHGANKGENFTIQLKKNNAIVYSTNSYVSGNCPGNFNIYSSSIYCNYPSLPLIGANASGIIVNLGNVWFDEISISTNGTQSGSILAFCIGNTY